MKQSKPGIQDITRIEAVKDALKAGQSRADIVAKFGKKWQVGDKSVGVRTIDRYIKAAKELIEAGAKEMEGELQRIKAQELEAKKDEILTDIECDVILSQIATGSLISKRVVWDPAADKFVKVDDYPTHGDRTRAISELFKRKGSYAAAKKEVKLDFEGIDDYLLGDDNISAAQVGNTEDKPQDS